jgi:hypothetical protein
MDKAQHVPERPRRGSRGRVRSSRPEIQVLVRVPRRAADGRARGPPAVSLSSPIRDRDSTRGGGYRKRELLQYAEREVARPGLEPGTPRFSAVEQNLSNSGGIPANTPFSVGLSRGADHRKLRSFLADLGTETRFGAQSGCSIAVRAVAKERLAKHQGRRQLAQSLPLAHAPQRDLREQPSVPSRFRQPGRRSPRRTCWPAGSRRTPLDQVAECGVWPGVMSPHS